MGKCRAQGLEHSGYLRNNSYYFMVISRKPAGCPCAPQEVWLNLVQTPIPRPMRIQISAFCFGRFPPVAFQGLLRLPFSQGEMCYQVQGQTLQCKKNPLEGCPIKKLKTARSAPSRPLAGGGPQVVWGEPSLASG